MLSPLLVLHFSRQFNEGSNQFVFGGTPQPSDLRPQRGALAADSAPLRARRFAIAAPVLQHDRLLVILPRSGNEVHLLEDDVAVADQLRHLSLLGVQSFLGRPPNLLFGPAPLRIDLVTAIRIRRIPRAPDAREFRGAEVADDAGAAEDLGEGADLSVGVAQQFPNFIRMADRLGGDIDAVDKEQFRSLDDLLLRGPGVVLRDLDMSLMQKPR